MDPSAEAGEFRAFWFFSKKPKCDVGDGTGKDSSADRFLVKADGAVGDLGLEQTCDKSWPFFFWNGSLSEVGGDDVEREKKVGSSVGNAPTPVGDLGALEKTEKATGSLGDGIVARGHFFAPNFARRASVSVRKRSRMEERKLAGDRLPSTRGRRSRARTTSGTESGCVGLAKVAWAWRRPRAARSYRFPPST